MTFVEISIPCHGGVAMPLAGTSVTMTQQYTYSPSVRGAVSHFCGLALQVLRVQVRGRGALGRWKGPRGAVALRGSWKYAGPGTRCVQLAPPWSLLSSRVATRSSIIHTAQGLP